MSQEYTEDKEVTLAHLSSGRRLLEALLIVVALLAVWLMAALLSFNPSDPSWSQTAWHEPIHNLGGGPGAWLADTLFFIFGVMAYFIPIIMLGGCWFTWRYRRENDGIDYFAIALRLIGVLALIITSCGLAAMNADDIWYFASGGVIGSLLGTAMAPALDNSGGTIALLCVWAAGLTLFTGWSWVGIAEKLGSLILSLLTFASNRTRPHRDDSWVDDEDDAQYDEADDDEPEASAPKESRRARIMRSALARRRRLADKFSNPLGRRSDAALFSGKRMDDQSVAAAQYSVQGQPQDPNDVLFSGHTATEGAGQGYDPLFDAPPATSADWPPTAAAHPEMNDPLFSGYHATQPEAAPYQPQQPAQYAQPEAAPYQPQQPAQYTQPEAAPYQPQQPAQYAQPEAAPYQPQHPTHYAQPEAAPYQAQQPAQYAQPEAAPYQAQQPAQYAQPEAAPYQPQQPAHYSQPEAAPYQPQQPVQYAQSEAAPYQAQQPAQYAQPEAAPYQAQQPDAGYRAPYQDFPQDAPQYNASPSGEEYQAQVAEPEPEITPPPAEPVRAERPPLYYFEEVEARRAREREQLEAWYQPIPEPVVETRPAPAVSRAQPVTPAGAALAAGAADVAGQAMTAAASAVASGHAAAAATTAAASVTPAMAAASTPRPQVKEGIGPQLPRPNRVRVPTRRELASYGIKLPSQREAERRQNYEEPMEDDEALEQAEQDELARQFAASQHQRYGSDFAGETPDQSESDDEDLRQQEELARQFAASQQSRYADDNRWQEAPAQQPQAPAGYPQPGSAPAAQPAHWQSQPAPAHVVPGQPLPGTASAAPAPSGHPQGAPTAPVYAQPAPAALNQPSAPAAAWQPAPQPGHSAAPAAYQPPSPSGHTDAAPAPVAAQDTLLHPLLMRNGDSRPLQKPTTPLPSLDLLTSPPSEVEPVDTFALEQMARLVEARLADFRIKADVVNYSPGPVITRFELNLAPGVKAARISNLSRDLARSLSTVAVRVVEVIPGKPYVGLELPNKKRHTVYLREVLDCDRFRDTGSPLTVVLGKDIAGEPVVADLQKMPHLLVAGTTGSGKSVGVNAMILSMLYKATPEEVRFIMIDPKMLELSVYEGIPHLLTEVVTDMKDAANALRWSVNEMERRYKLMSALGVRNLAGYNEKILEAERMGRPIPDPYWKPGDSMDATHPMLKKEPYIVVIVDEFADLMMTVGKKVEELIARLAQKARAAGIHLVLATQRPSVDVITGLIKANIPTRIAFTVSSKIDSRTILDQGGAESLLGMGDMLYMAPNSSTPIRVHGAFVRDQEVHSVVQDWKARGRPQYVEGITADSNSEGGGGGIDGDEELDALFDQAVEFVVEKRKASISGVQRQFRIGYNRAARIIEQMEAQGIVSTPGHNGNREVLAPPPFD